MQIPQTKKVGVVDEKNGIPVADPYRWLENADDPEVKEWIKQQNERVDTALKDRSFQMFSDELAKNYNVNMFSNPVPVRGRYFYWERRPDEDQQVLYMKKGLDGLPVELFNPNGKREGNTLTIDYWSPSQTGKYIAYGVSEGGDEMATLYVKDTENNQELPDKIVRCRDASIRWLSDDSAFFYKRNPRPGIVPKNEEHLHSKVYLHRLGDNPDTDELIFGADRPKDDMIVLGLSLDDRYLSIKVSQEWTRNEIYIYLTDI
jgi:prolyl oligopeptidase